MKSITVHGLDDSVAGLIRARAKARGESVNRTIKGLLEQSLGVKPTDKERQARDFSEFLGVWKKSDLDEFQAATSHVRKVDAEDWR